MVYFILRHTVAPIINAIFVKQINGIENLPNNGPYIIAANHSSYIDAVLLGFVLMMRLNRYVHFIAMKPLAKYWFGRIVIGRYFKSVFVNGVVDEAVEELKKGEIVVIFPEGGRTPDGEIKAPIGTGVGVLAALSGAPVLPVGIEGTFELWPRQNLLPKLKKIVSINFGKKINYASKKTTKPQIKQFINVVMNNIAKLCKKRYYY